MNYCNVCGRDSKNRTKICGNCAVQIRRYKIKLMSVDYKGGICSRCKEVYPASVFDFHHRDRLEKSFGISKKGYTRSWETIRQELDKCDMLCANCHRIIEEELNKSKEKFLPYI